jgi:hypothetical protein
MIGDYLMFGYWVLVIIWCLVFGDWLLFDVWLLVIGV